VTPGNLMRRNLMRLYAVRVRARALQEAFAVLGIAAGVALLFASQVASSSLLGSVAELSHGIVGRATLQLLARDPHGIGAANVTQVRHLPGVRAAAPLLEAEATVLGPRGHESVTLIGADESLTRLGGRLVRADTLTPFAGVGAFVLPAPVASRIGVTRFGQEATFQLYGRSVKAPLYEQLGRRQIGALASTPIAIAPLFLAQEMAGRQGRVSRILVVSEPGREASVRAALTRLGAGHANVESASYDERLFVKAATASNQSTSLFAVISALVGFLFAFNAMLLTVPQRRRLIADLRRDGYTPADVLAVMLTDAAVLGAIGCALGMALGEVLSIEVFHSNPGYLSSAFTVGTQRVVGWQSVTFALAGGMLAALVAVLSPLRDIFSRDPLAAVALREGGSMRTGLSAAGAAVCAAGASAILVAAPGQAVIGMVLLAAALLLTLPLALEASLAAVRRLAPLGRSAVPHVAAMELGAARARAVAVAATGAVAVFGGVAIEGAHGDLLRGLYAASSDMNASADVWIAPSGSYNLLQTAPFASPRSSGLAHLPGVKGIQTYRGGLLDVGDRRVWVIAPPSTAAPLLPASQIVVGDLALASARLRAGGWAVVSQQLAGERHLRVGSAFTLPAPVPIRLRVAALATNIGWAPGAIVMSSADFSRAWASTDASAYGVQVAPGASVPTVVNELRAALGAGSGLAVQSARAHEERQRALSRQGLARLTQITTLIMAAAVLAMAAAMGAMVAQRRPRLAKLKLEGFTRGELWRTVLLESALLLGAGCASGAVLGLYGQQLLDRALASVVNFPVERSVAVLPAASILAAVLAAAVLMLSLPSYLTTGVSPSVALQD
jgi:putative ABC transport system permease protein